MITPTKRQKGFKPTDASQHLAVRASTRYPDGASESRLACGQELRLGGTRLGYCAIFFNGPRTFVCARTPRGLVAGFRRVCGGEFAYLLSSVLTRLQPRYEFGMVFDAVYYLYVIRGDGLLIIDVDFEHERARRNAVQWIYEKYGRQRRGFARPFIQFSGLGQAIREVGKVDGGCQDVTGRAVWPNLGISNDGAHTETA